MQQLAVESGGWVWHLGVRLRFSPDETGRWLLREIAAKDGDYLSASRLARIRLADVEAIVNTDPRVQSEMRADATISPDVVIAGATVGAALVAHVGLVATGEVGVDENYRLDGPPGLDGLSDDFLRRVANAYTAACLRHEAPCKAIGRDVGVSYRSAQRWVYEARKRGIMRHARAKGARG